MSTFDHAFAGQVYQIRWLAPFQTTGLFPQARIIDSAGAVSSTVNLSANATIAYLYENSWTPGTEQSYTIVIDIYTDSGRTILHESFDSTTIHILVKDIGGGFRGGQLGSSKLDRNDIALLIDRISEEVWKKKFPSGETAQATLIEKSVFNVKRDKVKTDLKIPKVELSGLENRIAESESSVLGAIKVIQPEQISKSIMKETARLVSVIGDVQSKLSSKSDSLQVDLHKVGDMLVVLDESGAKKDLEFPIKNLQQICSDLQIKLGSFRKELPQDLSALRGDLQVMRSFFADELMPLKTSIEILQKELQVNESMMEMMNSKHTEKFNKMLSALQLALNKILLSNQVSLINGAKYSQVNE